MSVISPLRQFVTDHEHHLVDVTILMPCLNEVVSLPHCIANAQEAIERICSLYGLTGEIVVADNGSTDGSQSLAEMLGARVVTVDEPGYGAALIGGCKAAAGRYVLMADADGSYNFLDGVEMIQRLHNGADLCIGSRFKGGIAAGAMPWKNRYVGNPVLTGILNLFFRSGISDAHCGLRAISRDAFLALRLTGTGMEFASEMVIKAALKRMRVEEVPATLSKDLRNRPPHLRPWRDGWRHLRYLLMLSPRWVFAIPGSVALMTGMAILAMAVSEYLLPGSFPAVGNYWVILAAALATGGHLALILALTAQLYGVGQGYRLLTPRGKRAIEMFSLEKLLGIGGGLITGGILTLLLVLWQWQARDFGRTDSILSAILGTTQITLGFQTVMGGFLLAIVGGNIANFREFPSTRHHG